MKHLKTSQRLRLLLIPLWMLLIFLFSAQPGDTSEHTSTLVGRLLGRLFVKDFTQWPAAAQLDWTAGIDFWIRKGAHFTVYTILGLLLIGGLCQLRQTRRVWLAAAVIGWSYAATDEFHQLFVPGRSGQLRDVVIDGCGVLTGLLLYYGWQKLRARYRSNRDS